jgi:guanosine-3',5'-bis(diphosphate) 3'-pyrophosphohydrolase
LELVNFFRKRLTTRKEINHLEDEVRSNFDQIVFGNEEEKLDFSIAKCCNPIPGDDVFGFITINEGVKIHKQDCPNSISLQSKFSYRILKSKWIDSSQEEFSTTINISGIDNLGIVSEITKLISNSLNINMQKMSFDTEGNTFKGRIIFKVKTKNILNKLIQRLKKINGIEKVIRE